MYVPAVRAGFNRAIRCATHFSNVVDPEMNVGMNLIGINHQDEIHHGDSIVFGGITMNQTFTAVAKNDGDWWIGWIEEVPGVNCQERTREELLKTLRITLIEVLEMNRADARDAGGNDY
jgi:predicted RNase H-like HicB family nuclease